ncbi:MAG: hypothetical protein ACRENB_14360 [Gemmatimonadales bacterium]
MVEPALIDASYLEELLQKFLHNAGDHGTSPLSFRSAPAAGAPEQALVIAHDVLASLYDRTRKITWQSFYGPDAPFEPPLPRTPEPPLSRKGSHSKRIVACDPAKDLRPKHDVVGFVHGILNDQKIWTRFIPGTSAYAMLCAELKGGHYAELRILDCDLVTYTFRIPVPEVALPRGAMVRARIVRKETGGAPWFLCTKLWLLATSDAIHPIRIGQLTS